MLLIKICCSKRGQKNHFEAVCFRVSVGGRKAVCAGKRWSISRRKSFYPFIYKRQKGMKVKGITVPPTLFEWREWQVSSERCIAGKKQRTSRTVFFFPCYETNPGNRSLSEHHLTHQLFFVFLFQFWKTKTVFLVRKHARTASLIAAFPGFVIATPLRNILLTTDNKMFSYLLKRKEEKPDLIHSFNCLIILPVNVISPYGLKPAFKPPAHFPRT